MGEFGLRNKRELWRVQMALSKIRQVRAAFRNQSIRVPSTWVASTGLQHMTMHPEHTACVDRGLAQLAMD